MTLRSMFNSLTQSFEEMQQSAALSSIAEPEPEQASAALKSTGVDASTSFSPKPSGYSSPFARPYEGLVSQAVSCSKDMIAHRQKQQQQKQQLLATPGVNAATAMEDGDAQLQSLQSAYNSLVDKLSKAESMIREQDALIHAGKCDDCNTVISAIILTFSNLQR
jgi:hypothetical protein